jgi:uncharacterized protein (DUF58 family)
VTSPHFPLSVNRTNTWACSRRSSHFSLEFVILVVLAIVALVARLLTGGEGPGKYLNVLLMLFAAIAAIWIISGLVHLTVTRRLSSSELEFGSMLHQETTCQPRGWLTRLAAQMLTIEVVDERVVPGMDTSGIVGAIGADGVLRDRRSVECQRWGVFQQGPTQIRIGAPLGLFERSQQATDAARVVVLPPVVALSNCWLDKALLRHLPVQLATLMDDPQSQRRPQPPIIAGTRRYQTGDPLRAVDWRVYMRTHSLRDLRTLRYARPPAMTRIWLALDTSVDASVYTAPAAVYVQQALAVSALALAARWLKQPELEVCLLAGSFGASEIYRGGEARLGYNTQVRQMQRLLAQTYPQISAHARDQLIDQLVYQLTGGYRSQRDQAASEVVVLFTADGPHVWESVLGNLREHTIPTAVVDASAHSEVQQAWPVTTIQLLPASVSLAHTPRTPDGWLDLLHPLIEPVSEESLRRRAVRS